MALTELPFAIAYPCGARMITNGPKMMR